MGEYPAIGDHGLIGDLQTCALVSSDGTIDFFCSPRFDAPSVFASLLDQRHGGFFRVAPTTPSYVSRQLYLPGTAILVTRFMSEDGVGELIDFMPITGKRVTDHHSIVRLLRVVRGRMRFVIDCQPRFDYGRAGHKTELSRDGVAFHGEDGTELAVSIVRREHVPQELPEPMLVEDGVRGMVEISAGEVGGLVLETAPAREPHEVPRAEIVELFEATRDFWRRWVGRSSYTGRWRENVERSAMTLKLLTYDPTGAPVAAATFGLPEQPGGERNWDYRYTWVRDGSFSVHALLSLGYTDEARKFVRWLGDRLAGQEIGANGRPPLDIMYRVDGSSSLDETFLDHFEGWQNSSPVRVGNAASDQLQLDIYGEAGDAFLLADQRGMQPGYDGWRSLRAVTEWLCDNWDRAEEGIWETRGGRQHFTYGRVMSWVAFDRAIRIANHRGLPGDTARWAQARDAVYEQIMQRGWSEERQAFVQHYDTKVLDASLLYMPLVGLISPRDPRWISTLEAMDGELVSDSLVYRYDPSASPDGLRGHEGTFSICSFWYVNALARSGRLDDARLAFEKMLTYANHNGLYGEEIGPTGEQLGNFPQAFSHLSLISAAVTLDEHMRSVV